MKSINVILLLREAVEQMDDALKWLNRSYLQCQKIGFKEQYLDQEFDMIETVTSRFSRAVDLIVNKVFKTIDHVELEEIGSIIDVVNRAEKRGLVTSTEQIHLMKDIRNVIAHEYISEAILDVYQDVMNYTPELVKIAENIHQYCLKYIKSDDL